MSFSCFCLPISISNQVFYFGLVFYHLHLSSGNSWFVSSYIYFAPACEFWLEKLRFFFKFRIWLWFEFFGRLVSALNFFLYVFLVEYSGVGKHLLKLRLENCYEAWETVLWFGFDWMLHRIRIRIWYIGALFDVGSSIRY